MKRNGNIAIIAATMVVAIILGSTWYAQSKPDYVQDAATRLSSYLGNYYGPTACSGGVVKVNQWQVTCITSATGKSFEFTVMPSYMSPYPVARSFYLKANNEGSYEASKLGLMKYLQIDKYQ